MGKRIIVKGADFSSVAIEREYSLINGTSLTFVDGNSINGTTGANETNAGTSADWNYYPIDNILEDTLISSNIDYSAMYTQSAALIFFYDSSKSFLGFYCTFYKFSSNFAYSADGKLSNATGGNIDIENIKEKAAFVRFSILKGSLSFDDVSGQVRANTLTIESV